MKTRKPTQVELSTYNAKFSEVMNATHGVTDFYVIKEIWDEFRKWQQEHGFIFSFKSGCRVEVK